MAQWVKALGAQPDTLNSVFGTHMTEGDSKVFKAVLRPPRTPPHVHLHTHTEINECDFLKVFKINNP